MRPALHDWQANVHGRSAAETEVDRIVQDRTDGVDHSRSAGIGVRLPPPTRIFGACRQIEFSGSFVPLQAPSRRIPPPSRHCSM
jgi:hypothetical protein